MTTVSSGVLCILVAVLGDPASPSLDVPRGFTASVYASGIDGARDLVVRPDGTLTLRGDADRFEIQPSTADAPVTVLRVAPELDEPRSADDAALAVQAPRFVQMRWDASSGELAYALTPAANATGIPVPAQTLALARTLAHRPDADVAMAPDGSLFLADSRAGAVWHIRRTAL